MKNKKKYSAKNIRVEKAKQISPEISSEVALETNSKTNSREKLFALDIGTRSVIGIVADLDEENNIKILATTRKEHKTRAMLDGQIHDVPEVAAIINDVKKILEEKTGPVKHAAVAAAGRALYTMKAEAKINLNRVITERDQQNLEFAGVQKAQTALANSKEIDDPTLYYCVGYSTISYILDDMELKSLVGQRGNEAKVSVIATFLPRQVIDSMQSALIEASLTMRALTLEPIAAINVLIPPTMRHLNLALVDIGAGTSDVALTKNGSVFAYGMVPLAGDEITEAISQRFLLDFNVAENIKRKATQNESAEFEDILGTKYNLTAEEIIEPILPSIQNLAKAISDEILRLNTDSPQAVILVGGGALTPKLSPLVAKCLSMPEERVAVRRPEKVDGIINLPEELQTSDSVTPLGILKIASINKLHFLTVYINNTEYSLFNFRELTVSDAILSAGIQLKKMSGHPGLALTVVVDGEKKFFPGTMGTLATITLNGEDATLETPVTNDCKIEITRGKDGETPKVFLKDVVNNAPTKFVRLNGKDIETVAKYTINGKTAELDAELKDGDIVERLEGNTVGDVLKSENLLQGGKQISYTLNGNTSYFTLTPEIMLNGKIVDLSAKIESGDIIEYKTNDTPTLHDVLDIDENAMCIKIKYNKEDRYIPAQHIELTVNGESANDKTKISDGAKIVYKENPSVTTTVSDALLAVNFEPPKATSRMKFDILVNGRSAEFIDPVKNGDALEVVLTKLGESSPIKEKPAEKIVEKSVEKPIEKPIENPVDKSLETEKFDEPVKDENETKNESKSDEFSLLSADLGSKIITDYSAQRKADNWALKTKKNLPNIPGLSEAIEASKK